MWSTHTCDGAHSGTLVVLQWPAWHKTAWLTITARCKVGEYSVTHGFHINIRRMFECVCVFYVFFVCTDYKFRYFATCGDMLTVISSSGLINCSNLGLFFKKNRTNVQACSAYRVRWESGAICRERKLPDNCTRCLWVMLPWGSTPIQIGSVFKLSLSHSSPCVFIPRD